MDQKGKDIKGGGFHEISAKENMVIVRNEDARGMCEIHSEVLSKGRRTTLLRAFHSHLCKL